MPLDYKEYYRRNSPHYQPEDSIFAITFRLANSLPKSVIEDLIIEKQIYDDECRNKQLSDNAKTQSGFYRKYFEDFDNFLITNQETPRYLAEAGVADIVKESLHHWDDLRYKLIAYCIMPNHVHLMILPLKDNDESFYSLTQIMHSIKSFTANKCNKLINNKGKFWANESYDHRI